MKSLTLTSANTRPTLMVLATAIALMLISSATINAQDARLTVITEAHTSGKAFKGYMITVYQDMFENGDFTPIDQYMAGSGKQKFDMQYNASYMIDFATAADVHYTAQFNTHMATAQTAEARKFEIDIDFDKLDINAYPNTIELVSFDDKHSDFAFQPLVDAKVQQADTK